MTDPNTIQLATEAAKELGLAQLAPAVYQDVLRPAAKETGQNLLAVAKAVGLVTVPLRIAVWGYEQSKEYLLPRVTAKLAHKPASEVKTPDPVVAGPVIMGMAFASEAPHLREMYANLLATAMHSPSASKAHPSFAHAIQQLSPSEAVILKEMLRYAPDFLIELEETLDGHYTPEDFEKIRDVTIKHGWRDFCKICGITDGGLADTYSDNLMRLGILKYRSDVVSDVLSGVTGLKSAKVLKLSDYGNHFLEVCVRGV